jgi:hypothetical protein
MSHIKSEVSAAYHVPSAKEFFIHILLDLLSHILLIGSVFDCVIDDMLGLKLNFRLHLRIGYLDAPLLSPLVHLDQL